METTAIKNRNNSFSSTQKKQFENCLLPLWIFGSSSEQEISLILQIPITEITSRFNECSENNLIHVNEVKPTHYVLTAQGKNIVRTKMKFPQTQNEVA